MITAMIIDDELAVREGLLHHIQWKKLGIEKTVVFESAEKAMEYLKSNCPDIIISDIRLPQMNGLQLAERIRESGLQCKIIFISAYTDLEYFRGAIRLAVEAYVEKPIKVEQIEKELEKAVKKIVEEKIQEEKNQLAKDILDVHSEYTERYVLQQLFRGKKDDSMIRLLDEKQIKFDQEDYYICILANEKEDIGVKKEVLREKLEQYFKMARHIFCEWENATVVGILSFTQSEYLVSGNEILKRFEKEFDEKCLLGTSAVVVISEKRKGWNCLPELYQQVVCLNQQVFYSGYHKILTFEKKEHRIMNLEMIPFQRFKNALNEQKKEDALCMAKEIYQYLSKQVDTLPSVVKNVFYVLCNIVVEKKDAEIQKSSIDMENVNNFMWLRFGNFRTLQECYLYLLEQIENRFDNQQAFVFDNQTVNQIIGYIRRNFSNINLSVKDIADDVRLTPQYMTNIFKKKTGITVGQYIKEVRMEYSRKLLSSAEYSLTEVSEKSGYSDENYWSKVFKKEHGMNPSEFRRKMEGTV